MDINEQTVEKIARLAKLSFNEEEKKVIQKDMNRMIAFIDKIGELDTDNVKPLIHMNQNVNVLREDEAIETISQAEALKNAPQKDSDYFKIPKVLSK